MTKYNVKCGSVIIGPFETKDRAAIALIGAVTNALESDTDPTKWCIEKITEEESEEPKDVPEMIPDYEAAREYLGIPYEFGDSIVGDSLLNVPVEVLSQVEAFRDLLLLCKAWNKADGFVPDWQNHDQRKWFPRIGKCKDGTVLPCTDWQNGYCEPFVFATETRAAQFGEKFIDLFKQLYGIKEGE